jgi:hypothetical protein
MKRFLTVAVAALIFTGTAPAGAAVVDVVIQAGHEGRPASCAPNHVHACNIGASSPAGREILWTPIVADAATATLRAAGLRVARRPADYPQHDTARVAIFIHFDGAIPSCASGASIGFPPTTSRAFISAWERAYRRYFPFHFAGENISSNEEQYYGFHKVDAPQKMLIEYGELTCPAQAAWLRPRLRELGVFTAHFIMGQLH